MFIHLGGDVLVNADDIIAILNTENVLGANSSKDFLKTAQEEGFVKKIDEQDFKSMVITDKIVYLSPISSLTLKKRSEFIGSINNLINI